MRTQATAENLENPKNPAPSFDVIHNALFMQVDWFLRVGTKLLSREWLPCNGEHEAVMINGLNHIIAIISIYAGMQKFRYI